MFRRRLHTQREKVYVAYADYDLVCIFDFRGCAGPSLEAIEKVIVNEVMETLQVEKRPISEYQTKVYFAKIREIADEVSCHATVIVQIRASPRAPKYI